MKPLYILALLPTLALANGTPEMSTPVTLPEVIATADATQSQNAISSTSQSQSTVNQNDLAASASNAGNAQTTTFVSPRNAPGIGQGGIGIMGCGAGGNAGGSNTRGAAFLGIVYTPHHCQLLAAAQAYESVGQTQAACELIGLLPAVKKAGKEGFAAPDCKVSPLSDASHLTAPPSHEGGGAASAGASYATKEDVAQVQEKIDRMFTRQVGK